MNITVENPMNTPSAAFTRGAHDGQPGWTIALTNGIVSASGGAHADAYGPVSVAVEHLPRLIADLQMIAAQAAQVVIAPHSSEAAYKAALDARRRMLDLHRPPIEQGGNYVPGLTPLDHAEHLDRLAQRNAQIRAADLALAPYPEGHNPNIARVPQQQPQATPAPAANIGGFSAADLASIAQTARGFVNMGGDEQE